MTNYIITYSVVATNGKIGRRTFSRNGYSVGEVMDDFLSWISRNKIVLAMGKRIDIYASSGETASFVYDEDFAEIVR